ncbi:RHS repeat-associated core domain-containing protein [Aestuariibaculum sp. M13]|uniref:RHS repeat-associated core domain-containing protein n=1 Tax=unclassified Aestuariibaculum TaxID=2646735 RepID=UPI002159FC4B|nr:MULTISPECIES: RHS repeat-associated core domain-containing protein [unclassified Aestuariibaculum]MCR8667520.1 RHS repeat-associated core domain-containing protein [Aestuariibaculum sp. M13]WMI65244.1 RHS repeat-associated core domain-containing protein [Aestuariibaculum sp. YM273]
MKCNFIINHRYLFVVFCLIKIWILNAQEVEWSDTDGVGRYTIHGLESVVAGEKTMFDISDNDNWGSLEVFTYVDVYVWEGTAHHPDVQFLDPNHYNASNNLFYYIFDELNNPHVFEVKIEADQSPDFPDVEVIIEDEFGMYYLFEIYVDVIELETTWYEDQDGDGLGDPNSTQVSSSQPSGYVDNSDDQCPLSYGPSSSNGCPVVSLSDENYVYTISPQIATSTVSSLLNSQKIESVKYYDGLGRAKQSIGIGAGGTGEDVVTHIGYDAYGRQDKDWLPYAASGNNGSFVTNAESGTNSYYTTYFASEISSTTPNPYSEKIYDYSPLNIVKENAFPGETWMNKDLNDHTVKIEYDNLKTSDQVRRYTVSYSNDQPVLVDNGMYSVNVSSEEYLPSVLFKTVSKDENWNSSELNDHTTHTYKDYLGRVVLKRQFNNQIPFDTYYVYDFKGNLVFVLPPKSEATNSKPSQSMLDNLCFQYKYDGQNRLIAKKIPGKGTTSNWEEIVYNRLDQVVLTRDPNLKAQGKWLFTKYDTFGRVAYTGLTLNSNSRASLQTTIDGLTTSWVTKQSSATSIAGTTIYYNNGGFPTSILEIHTIKYYDDYTFDKSPLVTPPSIIDGQSVVNYNNASGTQKLTKGLVTGSKVRVLDTDNWITSVNYYDSKGRDIYNASYNAYLQTTDVVQSTLDFTGKTTKTLTTHKKGTGAVLTTTDTFTYDHAGRLVSQKQKIGGQAEELLVLNEYDALGQLKQKKVGGAVATTIENSVGLQTVDYSYNIRGWLKQINNPASLGTDLFGYKINYNDPVATSTLQSSPLFNGNISETQWKTANDNVLRTYGYKYDALNRITQSKFSDQANYFSEFYSTLYLYDKNGNIEYMDRNVWYDEHDDFEDNTLDYSYQGNKLVSLHLQDNAFGDSFRYYIYDANGNLSEEVREENGFQGIYNGQPERQISYNHLNLPNYINIDSNGAENDILGEELSSGTITYKYDATGKKIEKKVSVSGNTSVYTFYTGNYVYSRIGDTGDGSLKFFNHPEGYVNAENGYKYVYQFKDNLGNVRLSYENIGTTSSPNLEILEENNYYPFGLKHKGYNGNINSTNLALKYKFGGKEYQDELGLNWYDITARNYDPALGRWFVIDPKADDILQVDLSPYNYSWNNPVNLNDPDGECPWCWGAVIGFAVEYTVQVTSNLASGQELGDALTNVDGGKLLIATATGAATGGLSSVKVIGATANVYKAVALSSTAAGGNIVKQAIVDENKMLDPVEMATDAILEGVPIPKVEVPNVSSKTIKTAERQLDRAERVAGDNPRPSRAQAVKDSKEKVESLNSKKENIETINKVGNDVKDSVIKESIKNELDDNKKKDY